MKRSYHRSLVAAAVVAAATAAHAESYNAATYFPDAHPLAKISYLDFAKGLDARTKGAIQLKVFTGGVLVPPRASLSAVKDGIAQVGFFAGTYTPKELPVNNFVSEMAFANLDPFVANFAATEFGFTNPAQLAEWKANGVIFAGGYSTPPYLLFCNKPVTSLAEIKGKKLRMPGGVHERWARTVGAVSVNVSSNEMYTGLEKGALDCASNPADALKSQSLWEVAKHVTPIELGTYYAGALYAVNPAFWKKLPAAQRKMLFDEMAAYNIRTLVSYVKMAGDVLQEAKGKGVTVHAPADDLKAAVKRFGAEEAGNIAKLGKEKYGLAKPEALMAQYQKVIDKWSGLLKNVNRNDEAALTALMRREIFDKLDLNTYGTR